MTGGVADPTVSVEPDDESAPPAGATNPLVSFVIVTYNRPTDLVDAVDSVLDQAYDPIEVIVVSNSTDRTSSLFAEGGRYADEAVQYHEFPGRMGVPKARNVGFDLAEGEIVVTLDDDAVIESPEATSTIVSAFLEHDDVGAVAFQSRDYATHRLRRDEVPDPPAFHMTPAEAYRTTNFIGVGNAIRRGALDVVGDYPTDFVYGFEEMDLSLRLLDAGYDVLYLPSVVVLHKKAPAGRLPDLQTQERLVENRLKLAVRNLPWRYVFFTAVVWTVYAAVVTRRLGSVARIYRRLFAERDRLLADRSVIDGATIARIKSRHTMLFLWWYGPHPLRIVGPHGDLERLRWEV